MGSEGSFINPVNTRGKFNSFGKVFSNIAELCEQNKLACPGHSSNVFQGHILFPLK